MIQMLTACPPWKDRNLNGLVQLHILLDGWVGPPEYPKDQVSEPCQKVIALCFHKDEKARPSAQELLDNQLFAHHGSGSGDAAGGTGSGAGAAAGGGGDSWLEDSLSPVKQHKPRPSYDPPQMRQGGGRPASTNTAATANMNAFESAAAEDESMEESGVMEDMRVQVRVCVCVRMQSCVLLAIFCSLPPPHTHTYTRLFAVVQTDPQSRCAPAPCRGAGAGAGAGAEEF